MIKKQKKRIVFATVACLAVSCASVGFLKGTPNAASADVVAPDYYSESYNQGAELSFVGKKITYNGKQYDASVLVIAPDGKGYNGERLQLSQPGTYTVEYRFIVDGKAMVTSETFTVMQSLYEVTSKRSSVEFSSYTDTVGDNTCTREGVLVNLAPGDDFVYNKIIDVSDNTQYDKLLGLFVIPENKGTADIYSLDVTFTDVYDSSNYVNVTFKTGEKSTNNLISGKHYYEYISYMSACAPNQLSTGIDKNTNGTFEYNGQYYYKWVQHPQYGYMFRSSFYGTDGTVKYKVADGVVVDQWLEFVPTGSREMEIYFDYNTKQVHGANTTPNPTTLVCDLDDSAFFGEIWKGFTTGEVKMTIRGGSYVSSTAQFMITEIDGHDLTGTTLTDEVSPILSIDTKGYDAKALPQAKKGVAYPIFPATAVDNYDGALEVITNVYYNYNSTTQVNVDSQNGAFIPTQSGRYTIVYTTTDSSENVTQKTLHVNVSNDTLQLQIDEATEQARIGSVVNIPNYTIKGVSGNAIVEIVAKHKSLDVEYAIENNAFIPMYAGEYELVYTYHDYLENKTETRTLTVEATEEPVILDEITMPKYLLKNCIYELPQLVGYTFKNGMPSETVTSISITENGKTRELPNHYFAPQVSGDVTITYTVKDGEKSFSKSFVVSVVDTGYGDRIALDNYFVGGMSTEATSRYVELSATADETVYFATPLQVLEFKAMFQINVEKNDFEKMTVRFYDVNDETVSVAFHFVNTKKGTQFFVNNDTMAYSLGYDAFTSTMQSLNLNYYGLERRVTFDETVFVTIDMDENGKPFNGFSGNVAYMSCSVSGVAEGGEAGVQVNKINEQPFNNSITDKIKPQLFIIDRDNGLKQIGDEIYIAQAYAFDVLDPKVDLSFAVYDPAGNICVSTDGVKLDASADYTRSYTIVAKMPGSYVVRYQVSDGKGNKLTDSYAIKIVDKTPPVIEVQAFAATAKLGDTIALNEATATDNVTEKPTVKVYLYRPDGTMDDVTKQTEFTVELKGVYRVTYMAMDELKNVSFKTFTIVVS